MPKSKSTNPPILLRFLTLLLSPLLSVILYIYTYIALIDEIRSRRFMIHLFCFACFYPPSFSWLRTLTQSRLLRSR